MSLPEQLRLPDELLAENVLPFRRAQKPAMARRGGIGRNRLLIVKVAAWGFLLLLVSGVTCKVTPRVASSRRFLLSPERNVTVEGNRYVSREELFNALGFGGLQAGQELNLFKMNLRMERRRLEAIAWVQSAAVARIFPNRMLVQVEERTPIAFANVGGRLELVDKDGALLEMPAKASFDFPVVDGLDPAESAGQRAALLGAYLELIRETRDEAAQSGWIFSEVDVSDPNDLRALMVQGQDTIVVHFGNQNFKHRFKVFSALAPQVLASYAQVHSMDLRYHNEVVVDP